MSEYLEEIDGSRGLSRTEHALRSVLNSDIDNVRPRIIQAMERLGYVVISDQPLYARRKARGMAGYYLSSNILDYPIKLTIGLRQLGADATLVTFDYVAEHAGGMSFKGDQQTLTREAEAIIALADSQEAFASACSSCGTKQISEGRFCRVCGKPTISREPAELEVLRVTAGTRAGHHTITVGAIWTGVSFLATLALITLGFNVVGLAVGLLLTQVLTGLLILFWGTHGLSQTLNPGQSQTTPPVGQPGEPSTNENTYLSAGSPMSVTEGTTSLLTPKLEEREKETVYSKRRNTTPMD